MRPFLALLVAAVAALSLVAAADASPQAPGQALREGGRIGPVRHALAPGYGDSERFRV